VVAALLIASGVPGKAEGNVLLPPPPGKLYFGVYLGGVDGEEDDITLRAGSERKDSAILTRLTTWEPPEAIERMPKEISARAILLGSPPRCSKGNRWGKRLARRGAATISENLF
jgi:hypothetical protein